MQTRRMFLWGLAGAAVSLPGQQSRQLKPLAGIFPIVQTPFTPDDRLDTRTLAQEIRFLDRAGVHGVVWPQLASEYFDLTMEERLAGMEVVASTAKALRPAVVLGVQADDTQTALAYVRHAEKLSPDALIALPPRQEKDKQKILAYYQALGEHCNRPLFAQTIGDMSVDFVLQMVEAVPNLHFLKDEAGQTLPRLSEFARRKTAKLRGVFTGAHGRTLIDEMARGSAGTMPAAPFADLYVRVWEEWRAGRRQQAMDFFAKVSLMVAEATAYGMPGIKYLLELRGVFANTLCRSAGKNAVLDEEAKAALRRALDYVKPVLRA